MEFRNLLNIKIIIISFAVFLLFLFLQPFSLVKPGYVGVVVNLLGNKQGVEAKEKHVGVHFIPPWKHIYMFPTFQQNDTWEGEGNFHFQTSDGMALRADIGITFHLKPNRVPEIFQKYRRGIHEITHLFIRNFIRDAINMAASKICIEDLYGIGKEKFFFEIEKHVKSDLRETGIVVNRIYLIGRFDFPTTVINALNRKIEATQRAEQRENELREAEAEAKKQIAEVNGKSKCITIQAKAQAAANEIISNSLTPELIKWENIKKWDGALPRVTGVSGCLLDISTL